MSSIKKRLAALESKAPQAIISEPRTIVGTELVINSGLAGTHTKANNMITFYGETIRDAYIQRENWLSKQSNLIMLAAPAMDSGNAVLQVLEEKHG